MRKLNVTDRQTDRRTDGQMGGVAISPVPEPTAPAGDNKTYFVGPGYRLPHCLSAQLLSVVLG